MPEEQHIQKSAQPDAILPIRPTQTPNTQTNNRSPPRKREHTPKPNQPNRAPFCQKRPNRSPNTGKRQTSPKKAGTNHTQVHRNPKIKNATNSPPPPIYPKSPQRSHISKNQLDRAPVCQENQTEPEHRQTTDVAPKNKSRPHQSIPERRSTKELNGRLPETMYHQKQIENYSDI